MKSYEKYISKQEIEKIHEQTLRILSEVGVKFENQEALEAFKDHGVRVENDMVFIDEKTLMEALKNIPSQFILSSFKGDLVIGGDNTVFRPLGSNIYIQTGKEIRKMDNADIFDQFKLADTSPVITGSHINLLAETKNFTPEQKIFANMALQMKYANKPTVTLYPNTLASGKESHLRALFKETIEIVNRFEGNDRYHILPMLNSLSPLTFDNAPIEKLFATCEANQPLWIVPCAMPLMTAPPSVASMMAMTNAEQLAGIVLAQLLRPGIPVIYGNTSASTNMHTIQLSIGSPETALVCYVTAGLADYYHLPFRTGGGLSDAKDFDAQSGIESMMMLYASLDCGSNFIEHACGTLGTFNVINFEKFLMDEEIIQMVEHLLKGINCSDERFCFEEIRETGARGTFLKGRTPKMYREEFYQSKYMNKEDPNQWQNSGSKSLKESMEPAVKKRLESYRPPEISKDRLSVIETYIPECYRLGI